MKLLKPKEEVDHPEHYLSKNYECIDVMVDVFGTEQVRTWCYLNAFKYMWRSKKKNGLTDVEKAIWYMKKYTELENTGGSRYDLHEEPAGADDR